VIVKPADRTAIVPEEAREVKCRIEELRTKHPGICSEPWMPERLDQQKVDKTVPPTTITDDDPSAPNDSVEKASHELLAAISSAVFDRIGPVVAGTLTEEPAELAPLEEGVLWLRVMPREVGRLLGSSPAEADVAVAVALFPAGIRALITAPVDARIHVSGSADGHQVSISRCAEPQFLFNQLPETYDPTGALHLICDPSKDAGFVFVLVECNGGKFAPKGWIDGKEASRYAAESLA